MKNQYINRSKPNTTHNHTKRVRDTEGENNITQTAEELDSLARMRFPDGVRHGLLTGYESDIRQDAVLLALGWYLREQTDPKYRAKYPWHPQRTIAAALRIQKRDYIKALKRETEALQALAVGHSVTPLHPSLIRSCDWSTSTMQTVIREAIGIALKEGRISIANAVVGLGLIIDGITVMEMADRLSISRSAIYQHLGRVRREIPGIINGIEVPLHEFI